MAKQERHRSVGAEITAIFSERVPNFRDRSGAVVGQAVDNHGRSADTVSFVANFGVIDAIKLPRATLNRFAHGVLGHIGIGGFVHRQAQPWIDTDVRSAEFCGDCDFFDQAREELAAALVLATLRLEASKRRIPVVEVKGDRLMLTRGGSYILVGGRFPRLTASDPDSRLREILSLLEKMSSR